MGPLGLTVRTDRDAPQAVLMSGQDPFVMLCFGKPGSGKSNTQNVVLENLLLEAEAPARPDAHRITNVSGSPGFAAPPPCCALAFHFGSTYGCEYLGLCQDATLASETLVITSPTCPDRADMYRAQGFAVQPLCLAWPLTADHILSILRVDPEAPPLYGTVLLNTLRRETRARRTMSIDELQSTLEAECTASGQASPMQQRLGLLRQLLRQDERDVELDLAKLFMRYRLVVVDLTDPLMSKGDANTIFFVLLNAFRRATVTRWAGKVVAFDEAHKFFVDRDSALCREIVEVVEVMRHEGMRVLISTQNPEVVPPGVFALSTIAVVHSLHTPKIWDFLRGQYTLPGDLFDAVRTLRPGQGVLVAPASGVPHLLLQVRKRWTRDLGVTHSAVQI